MWIWDSRTHQFITAHALQKCKSSFRNLLHTHQEFFILGVEAPDRIFKDFTNHYYNCTPNLYGVHSGSIISKIDREINQIRLMLQNDQTIILHEKIAPFLAALLDTPLKAFIFELGVLAHYLADLHQPLHTDGKYRFADEETVHKILEADTRLHLNEISIELTRRHRIKEPFAFFTYQIYEINSFYDEIIDRYYLKPGKVKSDRWQKTCRIIDKCLSLTVMNTANVFLEFEIATRVFKQQKRRAEILNKVGNSINFNKSYRLRKYKSGTISLQARRRFK